MKAPFNRLHAYQLTARVTAIDAAPRGAKPGVVEADKVPVTARAATIDRQNYQATLKFSYGSTRTVVVRSDMDLGQRQVGEEMFLRITKVMAIKVEKPD